MELRQRLGSKGPKRILALDGGGIRGAISLGYLARIEDILRKRHAHMDDFRLCDYFDLIGGTSTGAIIAAALAIGKSIDEIRELYMELGGEIFKRKFRGLKWLGAKFKAEPLRTALKKQFTDITLGDARIRTGLCIFTKRADTRSTWPLINHPDGKYFEHNSPILLSEAVRASTAAPTYFHPEVFDVGLGEKGAFVDGGISTANNPALYLFLIGTLKCFPFRWKATADELMVVSVGTGFSRDRTSIEDITDNKLWNWASEVPDLLMFDASEMNQIVLQSLARTPHPTYINSEIGDMRDECVAPKPLMHYIRYNVRLEKDSLDKLGLSKYTGELEDLREMSHAESRFRLADIGEVAADAQVSADHLPEVFDLNA